MKSKRIVLPKHGIIVEISAGTEEVDTYLTLESPNSRRIEDQLEVMAVSLRLQGWKLVKIDKGIACMNRSLKNEGANLTPEEREDKFDKIFEQTITSLYNL